MPKLEQCPYMPPQNTSRRLFSFAPCQKNTVGSAPSRRISMRAPPPPAMQFQIKPGTVVSQRQTVEGSGFH